MSAQGEALALVEEFHREKLAAMLQHMAHARRVGQYDANNTYQYVISREDVQLNWLRDAISELGGGTVEDVPEPAIHASGKPADAQAAVIREDRDGAQAFVDHWRDKVEKVTTNARNRNMLRVILGETLEAKRFFDQMIAGREDLLGRRPDDAGTPGQVIATRWVGPE